MKPKQLTRAVTMNPQNHVGTVWHLEDGTLVMVCLRNAKYEKYYPPSGESGCFVWNLPDGVPRNKDKLHDYYANEGYTHDLVYLPKPPYVRPVYDPARWAAAQAVYLEEIKG